ncbi:hypothetical protein BDZ89DRAFT_1165745 [Hymenopellis radicata]|nr:hypothetical protein BDZ89DRAFT_1165745 [Hymenopellis radicata]
MSGTHDAQVVVESMDRIARVVASSIQHNLAEKQFIQNQSNHPLERQAVEPRSKTLEEDCGHLRAQLKSRLLGLKSYKEYRDTFLVMMQQRNEFQGAMTRRIDRDSTRLYNEVTTIITSALINDVMPLMLGNPQMIMQSVDSTIKYLKIPTWKRCDVDELPNADDFEHVLRLHPGVLNASERIGVSNALEILNNWTPVSGQVRRRTWSNATQREVQAREVVPYDGAKDSVSRQAARIAEKAAKENDRSMNFERARIPATPTPSVSSFSPTDEGFSTRASTPWTPSAFHAPSPFWRDNDLAGPSSSRVMGTAAPTASAEQPNVVEGLLHHHAFWEPTPHGGLKVDLPQYEPPDVGSPFAQYAGLQSNKGKSSYTDVSLEKKEILEAVAKEPKRSSRPYEWVEPDRLLLLFDANPLFMDDYVFERKDIPVRWRVTDSSFVADEDDACWAELRVDLLFEVLAPLLQASLWVERDGKCSTDSTLNLLVRFTACPESMVKSEHEFRVVPGALPSQWIPSFNTFKVVGACKTKKSRSLLFIIRGRIDLGVLKGWLTRSRGRVV